MLSEQKTQYIQRYDGPVIWNVSGFGNDELMNFMYLLHSFCEKMHITFPIQSIHGLYNSKFNGGRECLSSATNGVIKHSVKLFNDRNVAVKFTLSNMNIAEKDFDDSELRFLLDTIAETSNNSNKNGVICVSDKFAEFVRNTYPNLELISSHVKMEMETKMGITDTPEYYNRLFDLYDTVVLNTYRAFDDEFLSQILYPGRIEFIVNHVCRTNCQISCQHHKYIDDLSRMKDRIVKGEIKPGDDECKRVESNIRKLMFFCNHSLDFQNEDKVKYMKLNHEEINHLTTLDVKHFKIEGRDLPLFRMKNALFQYVFNPESCMSYYHID